MLSRTHSITQSGNNFTVCNKQLLVVTIPSQRCHYTQRREVGHSPRECYPLSDRERSLLTRLPSQDSLFFLVREYRLSLKNKVIISRITLLTNRSIASYLANNRAFAGCSPVDCVCNKGENTTHSLCVATGEVGDFVGRKEPMNMGLEGGENPTMVKSVFLGLGIASDALTQGLHVERSHHSEAEWTMTESTTHHQFDFATKESVTQMNNRTNNETDDAILATVVAQQWVISRKAGNVTMTVTEVIYHEH